MVPAVLLAGLVAFVLYNTQRNSRARSLRRQSAALARDTTIVAGGQLQGVVRRELIPPGKGQSTPADELRRRVENLSAGTYIGEILAEQDSALYHWPERLSDALRVYVEPTSTVRGWSEQYPQMARTVFSEWSEAGFPLRFAFIYDSSSADISIRWVDQFPTEEGQRIGVTERMQTSAFLIVKARVIIANHDSTGRALSPVTVGGIVRHEVGHALGLNHTSDRTSVMFRESATAAISRSDVATLRLLYLVPPGSLR